MSAVPREITTVRGCTCSGSLDLHRVDCGVNELTESEYWAAVDEARERLSAWVKGLNT